MTGVCRVCGAVFDRRRRNAAGKVVGSSSDTQTCPEHRWLRASAKNTVLVDKDTKYVDDTACQLFVAVFKGGATLDSIAEALGVSRERVRQIEGDALVHLRAELKKNGLDINLEDTNLEDEDDE